MSKYSFEKFSFKPYKRPGITGAILKAVFPVYAYHTSAEDLQSGDKGILMVNFVSAFGRIFLTDYGFLTVPPDGEAVKDHSITISGASKLSH